MTTHYSDFFSNCSQTTSFMNFSLGLSSNGAQTISVLLAHRNFQNHWRTDKFSCRAGRRAHTFYDLLSLNPSLNVGTEEIKKAYRSMALQYHPDVCPPSRKEESTRIFVDIHKAYEILSDPVLRRKYDYELGLVDLNKSKLETVYRSEAKPEFSRQMWEDQLSGLQRMSDNRMRSKGDGSWGNRRRNQRT